MTSVAIKAMCSRARLTRDVLLTSGARSRLLCASVAAILTVAASPAAVALAAPPTLTITSPANGSVSNDQTPTFTGTKDPFAEEEWELEQLEPVILKIYPGVLPQGTPVGKPSSTVPFLGPSWTIGPVEALAPGTYTAVAEQCGGVTEAGTCSEAPGKSSVTFTVDTTPPAVTLTSPANGSTTTSSTEVVGGAAGTASHDLPTITAKLYSGSDIGSQSPLVAVSVEAVGGVWSAPFSALSPGTYTARAEQSDEAGNVGLSAPVTFTVTTPPQPPSPAPPQASFKWFPSIPETGETVSLVSSSTDESSALTGFEWSLASTGPFAAGNPVLGTSFATAGNHTVRLRVVAADGLSSIATETISVIQPPVVLMDPFPVVRIAGSLTSSGVNLSLLTAQAPVGARVTVTCRGHGCPTRSVTRVAASSSRKGGVTMIVIAFKRFERSLKAGVVLEIRISEPGHIGKYTRFRIRRGKLPERVDTCLGPSGIDPITCPSS